MSRALNYLFLFVSLWWLCSCTHEFHPYTNRTKKIMDLPVFVSNFYSEPPPGFYFLTTYKIGDYGLKEKCYQLLLDEQGNLVYYRKAGLSFDFKLQPNKLMSLYRNDKFYLVDSTFTTVDSVSCVNGIRTDLHDFQILPSGNFLLLGRETIAMDLSHYQLFQGGKLKGSRQAQVECGVVQELDKNRKVVFEWHAKDHFDFTEVDEFFLNDTTAIDWTHFNAVEACADGTILITVRNFNEVTRIHKTSGAIVWRLGGKKNQFRFLNDTLSLLAMHDARLLPGGRLTLYDNGHSSDAKKHNLRAVSYTLDEAKKTASLDFSYGKNTPSIGRGNFQTLDKGGMLVNFGETRQNNMILELLDKDGEKIADLRAEEALGAYRAFFYSSLPFTLARPQITATKTKQGYVLEAGKQKSYLWSTGDTTASICVSKPGSYFVVVPVAEGGYISSPHYLIEAL